MEQTRKQPINSNQVSCGRKENIIHWRKAAKEEREKYSEDGVMLWGNRYKSDMNQKNWQKWPVFLSSRLAKWKMGSGLLERIWLVD